VLLVLAAFILVFSLWWSFLITIRKLKLMVSYAAIFLQCIWLNFWATPWFPTNSFVKLVPCVLTTFILAFDSWWAFLITNWQPPWRSVTPSSPTPNYYFLAGCQSVIWPFIFLITVWQLARRFVLHLFPPSLVSRFLAIISYLVKRPPNINAVDHLKFNMFTISSAAFRSGCLSLICRLLITERQLP